MGANHVIRVGALKDIDYYEAHLTEDLLTGMTIHSRKWKSVNVPEVLAMGEGPETWSAYFDQQMRWAFGCMDIFFKHSHKLLKSMYREQRRYYFMMLQHYFSGLAMFLGVILIWLYFIFGWAATSVGIAALYFYVPLIIWQIIINRWLQRFNIMPHKEKGLLLAGRIVSITALPIYFLAFVGVLRRKRLTFKVTPKGRGQRQRVYLRVFMPHLIIGTLTLFLMTLSFKLHHDNPIIIFWATITIFAMLGIPLAAWINGLYQSYKTYRRITKTKLKQLQEEPQ